MRNKKKARRKINICAQTRLALKKTLIFRLPQSTPCMVAITKDVVSRRPAIGVWNFWKEFRWLPIFVFTIQWMDITLSRCIKWDIEPNKQNTCSCTKCHCKGPQIRQSIFLVPISQHFISNSSRFRNFQNFRVRWNRRHQQWGLFYPFARPRGYPPVQFIKAQPFC